MSDDLIQRLQNMSAMINLCEKISWGQDTALMDEAADTIAALRAELAAVKAVRPLTALDLAEALSFFWNAAIGAAHERQAGMDAACIMAEGVAAIAERLRELSALTAPADPQPVDAAWRSTLMGVTASLVAAVSLLRKGGKAAKKAAPSDRMFDQMLKDYEADIEKARTLLRPEGGE